MAEFLKSYGTLILAIYGIIQLWGLALWKRYARKGEINIYETGSIEIGYSGFGPTIGLNGTLRALNRDVFIKEIDLLVLREKDKAQHAFRWFAFRSPKIELAGSQPVSMEIPSSFLITPNSPHRFNIVFNDNDLFEDIRPLFHTYLSAWYKVAEELSKISSVFFTAIPPPEAIETQKRLLEGFRKSQIAIDTFSAIHGRCYWEAGNYLISINVRTSKPDKIFSNHYRFLITDNDCRNLKLNVVTILNEPIATFMKIQNYPYNFAYSTYKQK